MREILFLIYQQERGLNCGAWRKNNRLFRPADYL